MNELMIKNIPELPFDVAESINQLRVSLGFCGDQIRTIMVTSSVPNEGKSFITVNLWKMLADLGSRVLLIDCDLRNSELRTKYGISSENKITGIAHYLSGKVELKDAIYATNIVNGFILPLNTTIANPTILLEGSRFSSMVEQCAKIFDYILIDTPPLGSVADALNIATHADGTVLVVRSGETSRKIVENSVYLLKRTGTPLLGLVLNRAEINNKGSYYYKRYYHYGNYYKNYSGYGYGKKKQPTNNK